MTIERNEPDDGSSAELFDYTQIREWVGYTTHSLRRHKLIGALSFLLVVGLTVGLAMFLPRKYHSETKLLANRANIMSNLGNPHRSVQDLDGPTRSAQETVMARDNLEKIIAQTDLINHWRANRNPLLRVKDTMMQLVTGPLDADEWMDIMVGTLEKRLSVGIGDGTLSIEVIWPDAQMARRLVETAQQNFLEQRHVSEVSAISETISILEQHASQTQTAIDEALANLTKVIDEKKKAARPAAKGDKNAPAVVAPPRPKPPPSSALGAEVPAQELAQLKFVIRTKQRAISDLEEFRTRQLTELRTQLEQQKVIYSSNHPVIQELEERIDTLRKDSPQLNTLKRDEEELRHEYESKASTRDVSPTDSSPLPVRPRMPELDVALNSVVDLRDDPSVMVAQDQLRVALSRYQDLLMRVEAARIELDTARAAFKYRFNVVSPPQTPRKPDAPNVPLILIAGLLAAIAFAFFTTVTLDLWKRRIVEPWQVERTLNLPVLAQVKL